MMKRLSAILMCLFLLCGCASVKKPETEKTAATRPYLYGVWVTYATLRQAAQGDFKANFESIVAKTADMGGNALFVHVRAFADSVYPSKVFPLCDWCASLDYDVLTVMTEICHRYSLEFHAWVNPYRVSMQDDATVAENSLLSRLTERDYSINKNGIYLNPASAEVRRAVIDGIRELLCYDIDGIHLDDYFYPTTDESFDSITYGEYKGRAASPLSLGDYRRASVNTLIAGISSAVREKEKVEFSVSPGADIKKNYETLYADVASWCKAGYIDLVIPQLYFGFDYPDEHFGFERLLLDWLQVTDKTGVIVAVGLGPYKLGTASGPDAAEWQNGTDVVARQVQNLYGYPAVNGAVFFSCEALFKQDSASAEQLSQIKKTIKERTK